MKLRFVVFTLYLSFAFSTFIVAQSPNFYAGEELDDTHEVINLFLNNNEIVLYSDNLFNGLAGSMDLSVQTFTCQDLKTSLKKTKHKHLTFDKIDFEKSFLLNDKQIIFYTNKANDKGELILSYQITENSSLIPGEIKDINLGVKTWGKMKNTATTYPLMYNTDDYDYNFEVIILSKNKDKFLYVDHVEDAESGKVSRVIVIDAKSMQVEKEMTFDLGITYFGVRGVFNNDFLYSMVEVSQGSDVNKSNYYKFIALSLKKEVPSYSYDLQFEGKTVETCGFDIAPNGDVLISGVFSSVPTKHYQSFAEEIFFHRLDGISGKKLSESDTKLDLQTIQFFTSKPNTLKVSKILARFESIKFYPLANGSINIILEETKLQNGPSFCNSLLISNVNTKGEFNWTKYIPKKQENETFSQKFISYSHRIDGNKLTLIYMDNKSNYDSKTNMFLPEKMLSANSIKTAYKNSNGMAIVTIDETGNITHKLLADTGGYSGYSQDIVWNKAGDEIYFITLKKLRVMNISKIKII